MKTWEVVIDKHSTGRVIIEAIYADWLNVSNGALHFQTELDGPNGIQLTTTRVIAPGHWIGASLYKDGS